MLVPDWMFHFVEGKKGIWVRSGNGATFLKFVTRQNGAFKSTIIFQTRSHVPRAFSVALSASVTEN